VYSETQGRFGREAGARKVKRGGFHIISRRHGARTREGGGRAGLRKIADRNKKNLEPGNASDRGNVG